MNEKLLAFRVGVVVLAAAALAVVLIGIFGGGKGVFQRRYTVYLSFPSAPNVSVDTPVRKNGVLIGRVSNVDLKDDHVVLTARIDAHRTLRRNEICRIGTASLLGDAVLEFVPSSAGPPSAELVQDGDFLADGVVATDPLQVLTNTEGNMQSALIAIKGAADEVAVFTRGLNQTFDTNDEQIRRIVNKSELTLDSVQKAMTTLDDIMGDPEIKQGLKQSLKDLPRMISESQQMLAQARETMTIFDRVGQKAEQNLDNLTEFTAPLGENGEQLMKDLGRSLQNLEEMSSQMAVFSRALNSPDGTLGKLINDRDTYDNFQVILKRFEEASRDLKQITNSAKIATDKIATDPRILGVKGALDNKPLGIGRKYPESGIQFSRPR